MAGTVAGGLQARDANLAKDPDFYKKIGAIGGKKGTTGGWYALSATNPERHRALSRKGGTISRRRAKDGQ